MNRDAVVIAGSGMMGSGIAAVSALAGERLLCSMSMPTGLNLVLS